MSRDNAFFWYELTTSDPAAAERFYAAVVGWTPEPWDGPMPYTIMKAGAHGVAGITTAPADAGGAGGPPGWLGTVKVADIDATVAALREAGGAVHRAPEDIPLIGRYAAVADPQGAPFTVMQPSGPEPDGPPPMTPGHVGWHELYSTDAAACFAFYERLFGWSEAGAIAMGPMGTYQLFADGRGPECGAVGGMMNLPPPVPRPVWGFYFVVSGITPAAERVRSAGGQVVNGPMEVPGGGWIVNAVDPQGAPFSLVGPKG